MAETLTVVLYDDPGNGDRVTTWAHGDEEGVNLLSRLEAAGYGIVEIVECDVGQVALDSMYRQMRTCRGCKPALL